MEPVIETQIEQPELLLMVNGACEQPLSVFREGSHVTVAFPCGILAEGVRTVYGKTVEWQWSLVNDGREPSPIITAFRPFSVQFSCSGSLTPSLYGSCGGLNDGVYPPISWTLWKKAILSEGLPNSWVAHSGNGRSSNHDLPFFVLENKERAGGLFIGIGWSGDWDLQMEREAEVVRVHAGMTNLHLALLPGERIRQPAILAGEYRGTALEGFRALRRHLRDVVQPQMAGKPLPLFTCFNNYYGDRGNFDEGVFLREIPAAAEVGIEYLVIDGGWTGGGLDSRWESLPPFIGNWRCPDANKFPQGFERIRRAAEQAGCKMGLWFDVEHAHPRSLALQETPELFHTGILDNNGCHLLRLETQAGQDWAFQSIVSNLLQLGAHYLKFDMNSDPAPIWAHNDLPGRRGISEIRYLEGLYHLLDRLMQTFPEMMIENCASGGRRIDLEMLRRSHTSFLSDHSQSEAIIRYHIFGAAHFLPGNQISTGFAHKFLEPNRPIDWQSALPAAAYLSMFGGNFFMNDRVHELSPSVRQNLRDFLHHFYQTRAAFAGELTFIGAQADIQQGVTGIAGVDPLKGKRAAVIFGDSAVATAGCLPAGYASLATLGARVGDMGDEQFAPAYLFYDE